MDYSIYRYPINLDMRGKRCVIIGGGKVAERKAQSLLAAGAEVTIIADHLTAGIQSWSQKHRCQVRQRPYQDGDLQKAFLVIAATDDPKVNAAVAAEAVCHNCLLNVIDDPSKGNFVVLGTLRLGLLSFSVFSRGNPLLTRLLLKDLKQRYGGQLNEFVEYLGQARAEFKQVEPDSQRRIEFWRQLLTDQQLEQVLQGETEQVKGRIRNAIVSYRS